jgi:hypothetical protein
MALASGKIPTREAEAIEPRALIAASPSALDAECRDVPATHDIDTPHASSIQGVRLRNTEP